MGMTIDAIETLTRYKQNLIIRDRGQYSNKSVAECSNLTMKEVVEYLDFAIETMRKYQKIQKIYQWAKDRSYLVETDDIMDKLKEVVEDGNEG